MKKVIIKVISSLCTISIIFSMVIMSSYADDTLKVFLNDSEIEFDVSPQVIDDYTMVPMRAIFEALGYYVEWNQESQTIVAVNLQNDTSIILDCSINVMCVYKSSELNKLVLSNGDLSEFYKKHTKILDYELPIVEGRTLVPVRLISEASGCDVQWDGNARSVYITSSIVSNNNSNNNLSNKDYVESSYSALLDNNLGRLYVYNIKFPLHLYGQDSNHTYLGKLTTNKYDTDSISNEYGSYGSKYSQTSIFNSYSSFGSSYSQFSPFNKYASNPPKIVDDNGTFVAYLTNSTTEICGATYEQLIQFLKNNKQ